MVEIRAYQTQDEEGMQQVCRRVDVIEDSKQRQQYDAEIVKDHDALAAEALDMGSKSLLKLPFLLGESIHTGFH